MQRNTEEKRQENVPRHPLSDITDANRPSSMDLDDKKEVIKAWRRVAYRKKKEEANVNRQDENLTALTISGKNVLCVGTAMIVYILPPLQNIRLILDEK